MAVAIESRIVSQESGKIRDALMAMLEQHGELVPTVSIGNETLKMAAERGLNLLAKRLSKSVLTALLTEGLYRRRIVQAVGLHDLDKVIVETMGTDLDRSEVRLGFMGATACWSFPPLGSARIIESGTNKAHGRWQELSTPATLDDLQIVRSGCLDPLQKKLAAASA